MKDKSVRYEKPTWPSDDLNDRAALAGGFRGAYDAERAVEAGHAVAVPAAGTYLVVDGRVMEASIGTPNYAGPLVHLITTDEELDDE